MIEHEWDPPFVRVRHLTRSYATGTWPLRRRIRALDDVSLDVPTAGVLAVVGESGSGKTTLGRCLTRLLPPDSGGIEIDGRDVLALRGAELRAFRRTVQLVFQDSAAAMNPSFNVAEIIEEPLRIQGFGSGDVARRVAESREAAGVPESWARRSPDTLSGGQRQRVALARALVLRPRMLVLDEVLRGLDLIGAAEIIDLLQRLRHSFAMTYLFITHDLTAIRGFADRIVVMERGRVVEEGDAAEILERPQQTYTRVLLASQLTFLMQSRSDVRR